MLVLRRKPNQTIRIGDDICVTVIAVEGGIVKLGIDAPHAISVHRGEIYERIQEENRLAASDLPTRLADLSQQWVRRKRDDESDNDNGGRKNG